MRTRRFGSFLIGGWLIGSVLMWFVQSQSLLTVERILSTPPPQIQSEVDTMGREVSRQMMRYQAMQLNRRAEETWEIIQLGIGAALFVTSILTPRRSKVTIACAVIMMALVGTMAFYLTPSVNGLGRVLDFLSPGASLRERAALSSLEMWHNTAEVLKTIVGLILSIRLLFDFYEFRNKVLVAPWRTSTRRRRHAGQTARPAVSGVETPQPGPSAAPSEPRNAG